MSYQKNQIEEIAKKVESLVECNDDKHIDVVAIARHLGLQVDEVEFENRNISGMIEYQKKTISIESRDPFVRKRFSVAHEIGHYVLHHMLDNENKSEKEVSYRANVSSQTYDPKEIEANHFAATLLMPENRVRDLWEYYCKNIDEVARILKVSVSALAFRLEYLGLL